MKRNTNIERKLSIIALIIIFIFSLSYGLKDRTVALPENPISDEVQDSSKVALTGELKDLLNEEDEKDQNDENEQEETDDEETEKDEEDEPEDSEEEVEEDTKEDVEKEGNEEQDESDSNERQHTSKDSSSEEDDNEKDENSEAYKDADGNNVDDHSPNIDLNDGEGESSKSNDYFTTTIKDGEVVTESDYEFRIIQKDNDYTVKKTEVFLNGKLVKKFNGKVSLAENENTIGVKVMYEDKNKETFTVTKSYTVHFNEEDIIITTNLEDDKVVEKADLSFEAKAELGDKSVPLEIKHNDEVVETNKDHQYAVTLNEGENILHLKAESDGKKKEATYAITYEKKEAKITIETDVEDETVSDPNYSFYAIAKADGNNIDVKTTINEEEIDGDGNGNYSITLNEGENNINFEATYEGKTVSDQYTVTYAKPDGGKEEDEVEQEIKLRISDLEDGQTIKNSQHTFNVEAIDDDGNRLTGKGVSISASNNGESIPINWSNDAHNSFTMNVQDGTNNITVTAKDNDGNIGTKNMTIHGEVAGEGEPIGHVTISLEATTIGLGHIIPPTEVELYANERGSETIDRIFEEHGITYEYTGSHSNSFYLSHLSKDGLYSTKPNVPDDLAELVKETASRFDEEDYYSDSLGEFDFTNLSGWMYSVNGTYPNVGFADYYFKDGDTVRIRFTLALGADIGGGMPGSNFGKEW